MVKSEISTAIDHDAVWEIEQYDKAVAVANDFHEPRAREKYRSTHQSYGCLYDLSDFCRRILSWIGIPKLVPLLGKPHCKKQKHFCKGKTR